MMMEMAVSSDVAVSTDASPVPTSITGTNLQETTMDKPDLVKTMNDGTMLVLQREKLHIFDAFPPTEMSHLTLLYIYVATEKMFLDESHQKTSWQHLTGTKHQQTCPHTFSEKRITFSN